ncbi:MAG: hypothetical protein J5962_00535 [Lachnospiraceae bacterium]|nr:hypothetical protein [Lachnospiraceae bacterium]
MKKILGALAVMAVLITISYAVIKAPEITVEGSEGMVEAAATFESNIVSILNDKATAVTVGGNAMEGFDYEFYVTDKMKLMVETEFLKSLLSCSVTQYKNGTLIIMKGDNSISVDIGSSKARVNDAVKVELGSSVTQDVETGKIFVPIDDISKYLNYEVNYSLASKWIDMARIDKTEKLLPDRYDMRDYGRVTAVRDQGRYGTCWAFASLGALESSLLPMDPNQFSTDHMTMCNSYKLDQDAGGEAIMSIAYMAAWQGPVYESDDPYGDGMSNPNLTAVKHLEEAIVIKDRDLETIKSAVFRYGGAETSIYSQLAYVDSVSVFYSPETCSYYYDGEEQPNHDIVIVGWDDNYSKSNFTIEPEGDGAFICKNSWGDTFGENGYFYVSYYDTNICNTAVVYTRIADADNYDNIYQSDLLGWVGQIGFGSSDAYLANVYTAGENENLAAVGFYATAPGTEFDVYVVRDFVNEESLKERELVVSGSMKYAGYYTVDFPEEIELSDGERFAVVVKIKTPNEEHPVAIEYNIDERTENVDISDGEGYISLYGELWQNVESKENCNVCLKAFTNNR